MAEMQDTGDAPIMEVDKNGTKQNIGGGKGIGEMGRIYSLSLIVSRLALSCGRSCAMTSQIVSRSSPR